MFLLWKKVYHNVEEKLNSLFGIKIKFKIGLRFPSKNRSQYLMGDKSFIVYIMRYHVTQINWFYIKPQWKYNKLGHFLANSIDSVIALS